MVFPGQRSGAPYRTAPDWGRRGGRRISPIFLGIVAVALVGAIASWTGFGNARFAVFVFVFGAYFTVLCLHEFGHAYTAHRAGDTEVAARGYLDLNPLRYMNPLFSLILPALYLIIGGLPLPGGAVLVNRAAARRRWQASLISASGPLTNIVAAGVAMAAVAVFAPTNEDLFDGSHPAFWSGVSFFAFIEVAVALLNLIPVPGLDGYGIIEPYLREETRRGLEPIRPYGVLLVLVLLFAFPPVRDWFWNLVNTILTDGGQPSDGPGLGQAYFQFWKN
jgi:Zn-dependent protease